VPGQVRRGDPGHRLVGVADAPAPVVAQREGLGLGDLVGRGGRSCDGRKCVDAMVRMRQGYQSR
jgi:hypothetical protein